MPDTPSPAQLDPDEAEAMLRAALSGHRLVFELGFDEAEHRRFRYPLFVAMRQRTVKELRHTYPALLVTYMSYAGTFHYDGGALYPSFHPTLQDPDSDTGLNFLLALQKLGLEDFGHLLQEEQQARRWITRILAQGGIPRSCLDPFAELVAHEMDAGLSDARSMLAAWRSRDAKLTAIHAPTRRFLLYGGDVAIDLVQRCVDLLRDRARTGEVPEAAAVGLPQYVVDAFVHADRDHGRIRRRALDQSASIPRPGLSIDPYDGLGPVVVLPPVRSDQLGGVWRVEAGGRVHRQEPSAYASAEIRVPPVAVTEVEFLTSEGVRRQWSFDLFGERPVVFFDPRTAQRMRQANVLAADHVWALAASATDLVTAGSQEELRNVEAFPPLTGDWSGFAVRHLDLERIAGISVDDGQGRSTTVPVIGPRAAPVLDGQRLEGVTTLGGVDVYSAVPAVTVPTAAGVEPSTWKVSVSLPDGRKVLAEPPDAAGRVDLAAILGPGAFGSYSVVVRGALGSDAKLRFTVVPQLSVLRRDTVALPTDPVPSATLQAPAIAFGGLDPGEPFTDVLADETATSVVVVARNPSGAEVEVRVGIPRLLWSVTHDTKPQLDRAARVLRVDAEEFEDHLADQLLIDVGRPGVWMQVELRSRDDELLGASDDVTTAGSSGRWSFDLGQFADTIRTSAGARLRLDLRLAGRTVHLADVVSGVHVRSVVARAHKEALTVSFVQHRTVDDRVVRLWSETQPWKAPLVQAVPNGTCEVNFPIDARLPPGRYLAEVAVDDPWRSVSRPLAAAPTTRPVRVGDEQELTDWLSRLDNHEPETLITWVLGRHRGETAFPTEQLSEVGREIAIALRALLVNTGPGQESGAVFHRLANVAASRDTTLVSVLSAVAELGLPDSELCRLVVRLLEHVDPTADTIDAQSMTTLWRVAPAIAVRLDLPWAKQEEVAHDRCRQHLGWSPGDDPPETSGAQANQLLISLPAEQLRAIRFVVALQPAGVLAAQTRQVASFDWVIAQSGAVEYDQAAPEAWYWRHRGLLSTEDSAVPADVEALVDEHLAARMAPRGTAPWGDIPALLLRAVALVTWRCPSTPGARLAIDEALPWAHRSVMADATLLQALPTVVKMQSS